MSFRTLKRRKLNRVVSFMLMLVMVATMLPLFSMPEVHAASAPTVVINNYTKTTSGYKITDISIENFTYNKISSITLSTKDSSDLIKVTTNSDVNTTKSYHSKGEYYVEFNNKMTATQVADFIKKNVIIAPSFASSDNHILTIKVTDVYGSSVAAVNLAEDSTIGTTADKPYKVFTADDLKNITDKKYSVLMNDINMPSTWTYINLNSGCSFDGQGYTINLGTISYPIFREVQGIVKNLNVIGTISGATVHGIVANVSSGGTFDHVTVSGGITNSSGSTAGDNVAGLVGYAGGSNLTTITSCVNNATVTTGGSYVGGICGQTDSGASVKFTNCINNGAISGKAIDIGGIAGYTRASDQVSYCYNYGTVTGVGAQRTQNTGWTVGGIVGASYSTISNCYNGNKVSGYRNVGGIIGQQYNAAITSCNNAGAVQCYGSYYNNVLGHYTGGIYGWAYGSGVKATSCISSGTVTATGASPANPTKDIGTSPYVGYFGGQNGSVASCSRTASPKTQAQAASACGVTYSSPKFVYTFASPKVSVAYMDYNNVDVTNKNAVFATDNYVAKNSVVTLASTASSPAGNVFVGWSTTRSSASPSYTPGQTVTLTDNLTLYPVFKTREDATNTLSLKKMDWVFGDKQTFSTDSLNNLVKNESSEGVAKKVSDDNPETALKVILLNESDEIKLYKLADVTWDSTNSVYNDPTWVGPVETWLSGSTYADSDIATNPKALSSMSSTLESEFFGALFDGVISGMEPVFVNDDATVKHAPGEDGTYYTRFNNVPAGMYAVVSADNYSPVVVSIFPYINGPGAAWYLDSEYIARLKSSAVDVNKWINEKDVSDTVAYKDTVTFDIDFKFPSLYTDRVTLTGSGTDTSLDYKLYAVDTMSPAFALINTETNKPSVTYSIDGGEATELPSTVSYYEFADGTYTGAKEEITEGNYGTYLYNGKDLLEHSEGKIYAVSKSDPIYTMGEPVVAEDGTTTLNITFNAHALKAFRKANSIDMSKFVITLSYQATVTDKAEIGSDKNTNEIVLNYEVTPSKMSKIEDTVYGYTYGLQVIKIDGTESTEEANKYLAGAKFKLYKEVAEKPDDMTNVYTYEDEAKRYFVPVTDIFTGTTSGVDENGVFTSVADENGIVIKGLKEGKYILVETKAPFGYNELAEDIYFEINKLTDDEASSHYGGRYKIFKEMSIPDQDTVYNESGMISISVLNYRGLTLPSTGGMGILLFTIIGIVMMMAATIILVVRRRNQSSVDYM